MSKDNNAAEDKNGIKSSGNNNSVNSIMEMIRSIELQPTPGIKDKKKKSKLDKEN